MFQFLRMLIINRATILRLARIELAQQYAGTLLGALWAVAQPLLFIGIYYLVFSVGLKLQVNGQQDYTSFLISGMVPWLFFQDVITTAGFSITSKPHLVKKVLFPVELLPISRIVAALPIHVTIIIVVGFLVSGNLLPKLSSIVYYTTALFLLSSGLGLALATLNVFLKDLRHSITTILTLWFWLTPIVWPVSAVPERFAWMVSLNPMSFIVQGYREALISGQIRFDLTPHLIFWLTAIILVAISANIFQKLRPGFGDVL